MSHDPNGLLPLKPVDLQLLLALATEEHHGYALVQAIEAGTNGLVKLDPGNLYRVIKRLLSDGVIAESERRRAAETANERRRYYRITPFGRRVLSAEVARLQMLMKSAAVRAVVREAAP